jgi:hypothetical protein
VDLVPFTSVEEGVGNGWVKESASIKWKVYQFDASSMAW